MGQHTAELLYYIAEDFCKLTLVQKINIGIELRLMEPDETYLTEEEIEDRIFVKMWRNNKFKEFTILLYKVLDFAV